MKQGKMHLNMGTLLYTTHSGKSFMAQHVTTGMDGHRDPCEENYGPIPPGKYIAYVKELDGGINFKWIKWNIMDGDWGCFRIRLHALPGTNELNRSKFFLHGGVNPGSAGCIDVGQDQWYIYAEIELSGDEEIIVEITDTPNATDYKDRDFVFA